ncbi:MAG: helix-turn-helix domain-containing protein [Solirubrobacteraceae bacterium]
MSHAEAPLGLRERKHRRTKAAIQRAAAELTLETGFQGATISRIAARAEISPRTVSGYFAGKDEIFFTDVPDLMGRFSAFMADGQGGAVDRIEQWIAGEADRVRADEAGLDEAERAQEGELRGLIHRAIVSDPELRAKEAQLFESLGAGLAAAFAAEAGLAPTDFGPQLFAATTLGAFGEIRARSMPGQEELGLDDIRVALDFLRAGAATLTAKGGAKAS